VTQGEASASVGQHSANLATNIVIGRCEEGSTDLNLLA
jgi:hypothetical protein